MSEHYVFMAVPPELLAQAHEIADMRGLALNDLVVEAISNCVESHQKQGWIAERLPLLSERLRIRRTRIARP